MKDDLLIEVEAALEAEAPSKEKAAKRCCVKCGKESPEVVIAKGRLGKGPDGCFFPEWICNDCLVEEEREAYPAKYLLELVQQKNESRPELFEAKKKFWKEVLEGKVEPPADKEGATHFLILRGRVVCISKVDAAAIFKCGLDVRVFKNRQQAEKVAAAEEARRQLFEERKESWRLIETRKKPFGKPKGEEVCEHPGCQRKAAEGYGVVNGTVVRLCEFCVAALFSVKREGGCSEFVFFRGKDAMERVKKHLAWLRYRPSPRKKEKNLSHRPFEVLNGGKK